MGCLKNALKCMESAVCLAVNSVPAPAMDTNFSPTSTSGSITTNEAFWQNLRKLNENVSFSYVDSTRVYERWSQLHQETERRLRENSSDIPARIKLIQRITSYWQRFKTDFLDKSDERERKSHSLNSFPSRLQCK